MIPGLGSIGIGGTGLLHQAEGVALALTYTKNDGVPWVQHRSGSSYTGSRVQILKLLLAVLSWEQGHKPVVVGLVVVLAIVPNRVHVFGRHLSSRRLRHDNTVLEV